MQKKIPRVAEQITDSRNNLYTYIAFFLREKTPKKLKNRGLRKNS